MTNASKTQANGFNFQPPNLISGTNPKFSHSMYDEGFKPKIGGKDIGSQMLSSSNGFNSGYNSDPYSMISSGLPTAINNSANQRPKKQRLSNREKETLYDETIKYKTMNNQLREDTVKLKTRVKILENELNRKEKTIEDLFSSNQIMSKNGTPSTTGGPVIPHTQTAQKYQQETFLVMSLKKQIRELKYEVVHREEELESLRKNMKISKAKELESELAMFRDECLRLRGLVEELIQQGSNHPLIT